jgi:hypothetical protein
MAWRCLSLEVAAMFREHSRRADEVDHVIDDRLRRARERKYERLCEYRRLHRVKVRAWNRASYRRNRERRLAKQRAYDQQHREQNRERSRAWHLAKKPERS